MPGSTPATSQLDWLISTTAITVLSWSKATRDLLKSFGWGIRALHQLDAATMVPSPRRLPHTISLVEEEGFEPSVPRERVCAFRDMFTPCDRSGARYRSKWYIDDSDGAARNGRRGSSARRHCGCARLRSCRSLRGWSPSSRRPESIPQSERTSPAHHRFTAMS